MPPRFGPRYKVPFRRRREYKTDYRNRLKLLKSHQPRAVVRKTLNQTIVQFIEYSPEGDRVLATAASTELRKLGWSGSIGNLPAAYLTGLLAGKRANEKNIEFAVLDIGLHNPIKGSKVFASLRGMLDAGISVPHGEDIFPAEDRISGEHISDSKPNEFEAIKNKILSGTTATKD